MMQRNYKQRRWEHQDGRSENVSEDHGEEMYHKLLETAKEQMMNKLYSNI